MSIWRSGSIGLAIVVATLAVRGPAAAQAFPRGSPGPPGHFEVRVLAGGALVQPMFSRVDPTPGPALGASLVWTTRQWGGLLAVDVQPFAVDGPEDAGRFRATYALSALSLRRAGVDLRAGVGVAVIRFEEVFLGSRTEVKPLFGASAQYRFAGRLSIEGAWLRTGTVRGFRSHVWTIHLGWAVWP